MLNSMTGYGLAHIETPSVKYIAEIKSLNSKFLEINLRLPKRLSSLESEIRSYLTKNTVRGKVSLVLSEQLLDPQQQGSTINSSLFKKYYYELLELSKEVEAPVNNLFETVLSLPDVMSQDEQLEEIQKDEKELIFRVIEEAVLQFNAFRNQEGDALKLDLNKRIAIIQENLKTVATLEGERIPLIRERIENLLEEWVGRENTDNNRLEQEMIYYVDKLDITEEKVRLKNHCEYFLKVLQGEAGNGKKLGFISQEIGREINTIGSKANHVGIQQVVVQMKEELEKIKEQLLNVL